MEWARVALAAAGLGHQCALLWQVGKFLEEVPFRAHGLFGPHITSSLHLHSYLSVKQPLEELRCTETFVRHLHV